MYKDPSEFRERFKAYKEGKSVREIYGLPEYQGGKLNSATKKKIDYYYKLLINNGFDQMSAVGILGNMMQESSFNPDSINLFGYKGLLLNSKEIQQAIINQYGDHSELSLLRYLSDWTDGSTWVRKGPHAKDTALYSKSYLRKGYKTPEEAAFQFLKRYERAIVVDKNTKLPIRDKNGNYVYQDKDKRLNYARQIYNYLNNIKPVENEVSGFGKTYQQEPIINTPDATRVVTTIPQEKAIDYTDKRNTVGAAIDRSIWAHQVMLDINGMAYDVPIWESKSLPALEPVDLDVTPFKTYTGGKLSGYQGGKEAVIKQGPEPSPARLFYNKHLVSRKAVYKSLQNIASRDFGITGKLLDEFMSKPPEAWLRRTLSRLGYGDAIDWRWPDLLPLGQMSRTVPAAGAGIYLAGDEYKNGKLPGYKDGTRMEWDADTLSWRHVMDDPYADVFNNMVVTPKYIRPKFKYETDPNYQQLNRNEVVKSDDTLWTRLQVEKANNTRTWRSDAADVMHSIGEGAMLASTFAAPEIEPLVYPTYNAVKTAVAGVLKSNTPVMQYLRYPVGKLMYGFDAQFPTLYRKIKALPIEPKNGTVLITNPNSRFAFESTGTESPVITNFTFDAPVRAHAKGNWDSGFTMVIPGRTLLGKNVISTEPSDVFTYGDNIKIPLNKVNIISGDDTLIEAANKYGYKVITSPRLLNLFKSETSTETPITSIGRGFNLAKDDLSGYAKEVELTARRLFGSPTQRDIDFMNFVLLPKIKGATYNPNDLDYLIKEGIEPFGDRFGNAQIREYLLDPDRWKYLLYDPATHAESNFRNSMGIVLKKDIPLDNRHWKDGKLPGYKNGKIYIKPANRGKFNATKKRTGKTTEELTHSKNPITRKRAIFALNAKKWHHK